MRTELISACQMFLAPSTILFAAIGLARTEGLKAGISLVGLMTAAFWCAQVAGWPGLTTLERVTAGGMAVVFAVVWGVSVFVHMALALGKRDWLPQIMRPVESVME